MQARHFVQLIGMSALWGASFPLLRIASPAFGPMALAGIRCGLAALVLALLMREIPASAATSSAFMIPLFGVTWGGLFLGEPVTGGMVPGSLFILAATALITGFNPWRAWRSARRTG